MFVIFCNHLYGVMTGTWESRECNHLPSKCWQEQRSLLKKIILFSWDKSFPLIFGNVPAIAKKIFMKSTELHKVLDLSPNLDFKVRLSSFQSFMKIRKEEPLYTKKGIDWSYDTLGFYMCQNLLPAVCGKKFKKWFETQLQFHSNDFWTIHQ